VIVHLQGYLSPTILRLSTYCLLLCALARGIHSQLLSIHAEIQSLVTMPVIPKSRRLVPVFSLLPQKAKRKGWLFLPARDTILVHISYHYSYSQLQTCFAALLLFFLLFFFVVLLLLIIVIGFGGFPCFLKFQALATRLATSK
jgi:hypothetical protein